MDWARGCWDTGKDGSRTIQHRKAMTQKPNKQTTGTTDAWALFRGTYKDAWLQERSVKVRWAVTCFLYWWLRGVGQTVYAVVFRAYVVECHGPGVRTALCARTGWCA